MALGETSRSSNACAGSKGTPAAREKSLAVPRGKSTRLACAECSAMASAISRKVPSPPPGDVDLDAHPKSRKKLIYFKSTSLLSDKTGLFLQNVRNRLN
jgi:hypothetical protein